MDVHTRGISFPFTPHRLKQAPDICFLGDQDKQGPTVAERAGGASTPPQLMTRPRRAPTAEHHHQEESHDGQAAVPVGSAPRAG